MSSLTLLPSNAVAVSHGAPTTTSLVVAEVFGKRHADVLRDIDNLECSPEFHERNFAFMVRDVQIGSGAVRQDRYCEMTKDGFAFQVMGYTGPKAAQFKEAYINRFNEMEAALRQPQAPPDINRVHRWNAVRAGNRWDLDTAARTGLSYLAEASHPLSRRTPHPTALRYFCARASYGRESCAIQHPSGESAGRSPRAVRPSRPPFGANLASQQI